MSLNIKCAACSASIPEELADLDPQSNFRTVPPEWLQNKYYIGVGMLMTYYSSVETCLAIHLQDLIKEIFSSAPVFLNGCEEAGVSALREITDHQKTAGNWLVADKAVKLITEKLNISSYMDTMISLLKVQGCSDKCTNDLKSIFSQLKAIGAFRNRLVHNGAYMDFTSKGEWFHTSDHHFKAKEIKLMYFEVESLFKAARDLSVMPNRIADCLVPKEAVEAPIDPITKAYYGSDEYKKYIADRDGPWYYQSTMLTDAPIR
ncbi:hypothetical protein [Pseudomonas sp. RIT-PI-S]|uniref:hypothetical protein n=1 Tax=Pseudomonas sp. RIT-PI-S TaxID=3035295 RepID=UPI0021DA1DD1|nr:hypothetical protein [Pseudomonas sp. RIT-PI-S]